MQKVLLLGDSLLKGVVINSHTMRYKVADGIPWDYLSGKLNFEFVHLSRMGATVTYGFARLKEYLSEHHDVHAVVIEFGGNDCDFYWAEVSKEKSRLHIPKTPLRLFKDTLAEMIGYLKERNIRPVLMSLPPIHSEKYFAWITRQGLSEENILYFLGDKEHIYRHHESYNEAISEAACDHGIKTVNVRKMFLLDDRYPELLCEDGIHVNETGQKMIMDCFIDHYSYIAESKTEDIVAEYKEIPALSAKTS